MKLRWLYRLVIVLCALGALAAVALADYTLSWQLKGSGRFKVELFGVGDAYPSRQTFVSMNYQWNAGWSYLVYRWYFIRVTNLNTGQAKQTVAFVFDPQRNGGTVLANMSWSTNYLLDSWNGLAPRY